MKSSASDKEVAIEASGRERAKIQNGPGRSTTKPEHETDREEALKALKDSGSPGRAHQLFAGLEGEWKAEVKFCGQPADAAGSNEGTASARLKFGGRFLEEDFDGEALERPFSGYTLMGFDNARQVFTSVWISSTQTGTFVSEGTADTTGKTITLHGTSTCPTNGRREMKSVLRLVDPDKHVFEMFDVTDGQEAKLLEVVYTRA